MDDKCMASNRLYNSCMMDILRNIQASLRSSHDKLTQIPPNPSYLRRPLDHQHFLVLAQLPPFSILVGIGAMGWHMRQRQGKEQQRSMSREFCGR